MEQAIYKDAGEITVEDLNTIPCWEFCLGLEHLEGFTECTVKSHPVKSVKLGDDCIVAADFVISNGEHYCGAILTGFIGDDPSDLPSMRDLTPEIFLKALDGTGLNENSDNRVGFCLPSTTFVSSEEIENRIQDVFRMLGVNKNELFPIEIRPHIPVVGLDKILVLKDFTYPEGEEPRLG